MPSGFEEIGLAYKVLSLTFEIGRSGTNRFKEWRNNSKHRLISSLTTMEFIEKDNSIIAHYVQDRILKITGDDVRIPPFTFGTVGEDTPGEITVITAAGRTHHYKPRRLEDNGLEKTFGIDAERLYTRGEIVRCIFPATSMNGFPLSEEDFTVTVNDTAETSNTLIIFAAEKPPLEIEVTFRKMRDASREWRQVTREKNELRQFPGGRSAFILEAHNPPIGHEYKIAWKW